MGAKGLGVPFVKGSDHVLFGLEVPVESPSRQSRLGEDAGDRRLLPLMATQNFESGGQDSVTFVLRLVEARPAGRTGRR
jgi:hypothetical protein